jgi:hypothetical protein
VEVKLLLLETEAAEEDYEEAEVAVDQIDQDLTKIKGLEMISSEPEKVPTQSKSEIADKDNNNKRYVPFFTICYIYLFHYMTNLIFSLVFFFVL